MTDFTNLLFYPSESRAFGYIEEDNAPILVKNAINYKTANARVIIMVSNRSVLKKAHVFNTATPTIIRAISFAFSNTSINRPYLSMNIARIAICRKEGVSFRRFADVRWSNKIDSG